MVLQILEMYLESQENDHTIQSILTRPKDLVLQKGAKLF